MILDALLKLSAAQQVTADAVSTNTIDLSAVTPARQIGSGEPMAALIAITAIGTNSGSSKLQVIQSANANLSSPDIIGELDLATADIAAGKAYVIPLPKGYPTKRYLGVNHDITGVVDYTVDTYVGPLSMLQVQVQTYAKGYTIS